MGGRGLDWTTDSRFATASTRLENVDELDRLTEEWTSGFPPEEVMRIMQRHGVAATVVQNAEDLVLRDDHLRTRGFFIEMDDPIAGKRIVEGLPFRFSDSPRGLSNPAPLLGQHTDQILREMLHMDPDQIEELRSEGVIH